MRASIVYIAMSTTAYCPRARSAPSAIVAIVAALAMIATLAGTPRAGGAQDGAAKVVFRRFSDRVVKIQVVETGSAAKAGLGSGFFVSPQGHLVTNYHVVAKLVHHPNRYRAELIDTKGKSRPVTVVAIDVVHDLAVLASGYHPEQYFALGAADVGHGDRLYSLGHPNDLGLSIVEGTYNGLLQHTLYPKIHFTGSLNAGMSGGPTISATGRVIGVNVSTAGNQVSFLVPADRAAALVNKVLDPGFRGPKSFLEEVGKQILAYQDIYLARIFADSAPTVALGSYVLPTEPAPFFKCWADAERDEDMPYEVVNHQCSTDDYLYISDGQWSGIVEMDHWLLSSTKLNPLRFFSLYTSTFRQGGHAIGGAGLFGGGVDSDDFTPYRCETRNVRHAALRLRAVFCLRRYKKFDGLYDATVKAAVLGTRDTGLVTTLSLSGVSYVNARHVARRYLERIAWRPR